MGVCRVDDITKLVNAIGQGGMYYVLRSVYDKSKTSYIPVEEHQVKLRELITKENALELFTTQNYDTQNTLVCGEIAYVLQKDLSEVEELQEEL